MTGREGRYGKGLSGNWQENMEKGYALQDFPEHPEQSGAVVLYQPGIGCHRTKTDQAKTDELFYHNAKGYNLRV